MLFGVGWCVCLCAFLCVGWYVPLEVRFDFCALRTVNQSPLEYAPTKPYYGFAALEAKSDDPSTQNWGGPKARAAPARAL